jgi:hypothetical protein
MSGTQQGLACIACHDIKHHKTEAESKGPNLALMTERVTYDWFVRWMENPQRHKPGVPMPAFFAGQEPAVRQQNIDALWDYLAQGEKMELPEELHVDPNQFVLKPSTHPIHTRTYIRLPDGRELLRAICVGLPNGISYCFDAETCQLAYVWTGGFLDMAPHWQNQSGMPTPPLGAPFHLAAKDEGILIDGKAPAFLGYEIVDGIPRFEFAVGDGGGRGGSTIRDSMSLGALLYLRPDMRHLGNDAINPQWIWRFSPEELAAYEKLPSALPTTLSHRQELLPGDDPDTVALRIRFKDGRTDWIAVASKERELKAGEQTGRGVALWERTDASGKVTELIPLQPKPDNTQ